MKPARAVLLGSMSVVLYLWLSLLASQQSPPLIFAVFMVLLFLGWSALRSRLSNMSVGNRVLLGALTGFAAMIAAGFISECALRGSECLQRGWLPNFYFFPSISFGWLYGAIAFVTTTRANATTAK